MLGFVDFVRQFYGRESEYIFYDHLGRAQEVAQAEAGEQGEPLMPGLRGGHPAPGLSGGARRVMRMCCATQQTQASRLSPAHGAQMPRQHRCAPGKDTCLEIQGRATAGPC